MELYSGVLNHTVTKEMIDSFLLWAVAQKASDVVLVADNPVWVQIHGKWLKSTSLALTDGETLSLLAEFTEQPQAGARVKSGESLDFAYSIRIGRGHSQRFRVNATHTNKGIYMVMRVLPSELPQLKDQGLSLSLVDKLFPSSGLVICSGVMGSGKTTLLIATLVEATRTQGRQILSLEEPIEYDLSSIPHEELSAPVAQSCIGLDVRSWAAGVRSMTRRKGEMVLVGEARDLETLSNMLGAVEQGVTAYTTVHAPDVPQTITRIVNAFPEEERPSVAAVLVANLRLIIHQRLVPRVDKEGRVALREFLVFDESIRQELYVTPYREIVPAIRKLVDTHGQSLSADAEDKFNHNIISNDSYLAIAHEQRVNRESILHESAAS